jgi:hypothetical protein
MKSVLVSTTQRCGSTWLAQICQLITGQSRPALYVEGLSCGLKRFHEFGENDETAMECFITKVTLAQKRNTACRVFKTHDLPPYFAEHFLTEKKNFLIVNVQRDFRDVLVSRLMYNRHHLPKHHNRCESAFVKKHMELDDRSLVEAFLGSSEMLQWLTDWKLFSQPCEHRRYLKFRYESMLDEQGHLEAVRHLIESMTTQGELTSFGEERIKKIVKRSCFNNTPLNRAKQRVEKEEVKDAFCRVGRSGNHLDYMTARQASMLRLLSE